MANELYLPQAEYRPAPTSASWTLRVFVLGLLVLIGWGAVSQIDQVTRASAQMIAKGRTQVVQSPDGGVLKELLVQEGDAVKAGQLLASLEKARANAAVDDSGAKIAALRVTLTRLHAELANKPLVFDADLRQYPLYIRNQTALYQQRKRAINEDVAALESMRVLANDELQMNAKLEATGDVSRSDILRLRRQVTELQSQITNKRNKYYQDAQAEMTKAQEDLNSQTESLRDRTQLLKQTALYAPADGIVKNVLVTTVGGVLRPGEALLEILPTDRTLIAEAKISPADIAFVRLGQSASVSLDAYDSAIFGNLKGEVVYISADTLREESQRQGGPQTYYRVHVQIKGHSFEGERADKIEVRPGMTATVSIKAAERSVLSYLTKPVIKTLSQSLGEH